MKRKSLLLFGIFLVVPVFAWSQSAYLPYGENGILLESFGTIDMNPELTSVGLSTGFSIAGVFDIGFHADLRYDTLSQSTASIVGVGGYIGAFLLKEDRTAPFSLRLRALYGFTRVLESDFLEANDFERTGNGYKIGLDLIKDLIETPRFRLHAELGGYYRSFLNSTIPEFNPSEGSASIENRESELAAEGLLSFAFVFENGSVVAPGGIARYNWDGDFEAGPVLTVVIPTGRR